MTGPLTGTSALPVTAGARVRDRLATAPDGPLAVLHRGRAAVHLRLEGADGAWCVGVVGSDAPALPHALRLGRPDVGRLADAPARVAGGVLHLGDVRLPVQRVRESRVPTWSDGLPVPGSTGRALDFAAPVDEAGVLALLGRGPGLTPLGDDVLVGWLAAHVAAGVAVPALADAARARTTLLSTTLIALAAEGEVVPELATFLRALGTHREAAATGALLAVGSSSGAGMRYGVERAVAHLSEHGPHQRSAA